MSQKLPGSSFQWLGETCQFNEDVIISCYEDSDKGCFFEIDVQYPKELHELHNDLSFSSERMKIEKVEKCVTNLHDKRNALYT